MLGGGRLRCRHWKVELATAQDLATVAAGSVQAEQKIIYSVSIAPNHDWPGHPECAARGPAIVNALKQASLTQDARPNQLISLRDFQPATLEDVCSVHDPRFVEALQGYIKKQGKGVVDEAPTYVTADTFQDSLKAVGCAQALIDAVVATCGLGRGAASGFGICRPPGHHAVPSRSLGFCIFSTIAIAAKYAQARHGLRRVLIFDFDVHHGNGTHDTFFEDPDVMFVSTHQNGSYPGTGRLTEVGRGDGEGTTINLPLPAGSGESAMLQAWEEIVAPAAEKFNPDIILVSAGYDAHWNDPLASLQLCSATFHRLGKEITSLANRLTGGKVVYLLEGGYNLQALGESVAETFRGILDLGSQDAFDASLLHEAPAKKVQAMISEARKIHQL